MTSHVMKGDTRSTLWALQSKRTTLCWRAGDHQVGTCDGKSLENRHPAEAKDRMTTKKSEVPSGNREIVYRSRKPAGHVPAIQRYSARAKNQAPKAALFVGAQGSDLPTIEREGFVSWISEIAQSGGGVESHDVARFTDVDGMLNVVAALYWSEASAFQKWQTWSAVSAVVGQTGGDDRTDWNVVGARRRTT